MKITLQETGQTYAIQAYAAGRLVINQQTYQHSLILTPEQLIPDWRPQTVSELTSGDFEPLLALAPTLILLGTGDRQVFPAMSSYAGVLERGIGLEIMATAAACRTYNILMGEGRRVAAALMMI